MIYQLIISRLNTLKDKGEDIGSALRYCTDSIVDLLDMYENQSKDIDDLVQICLDNK